MRALLLVLVLVLIGGCVTKREATLPTLAVLPSAMPTGTSEVPTSTPVPITNTPSPILLTNRPPEAAMPVSFPVLIGTINVTSAPGIVLRRAPDASADVIAVMAGGTVAQAQRRTGDSQWIEVMSEQGVAGWVAAHDVFAVVDLAALPALGVTSVVAVPTLTITPTLIAVPTDIMLGDVPAMEQRLEETPILENLTSERTRSIFDAGQGLGNRADVFTTIGDSNSTNGDFLQPIGMGADVYCTWGAYDYLHATVAYFSTPPTGDESSSFTHHSLTARKGFNSAAVLDPFWATDPACAPGESPLSCEYRTVKPSAAIIMIGGIDVNDLSSVEYAANLRAIVQTSIQQGVIPLLTTFVVLPDRDVYERSLEFNMALLDIARDEQIPLINLWAAAQTLPDEGIGPDRTHLKAEIGSFCAFDGGQNQFGGTLRNLLTLQALDGLRQGVLAG